MGKRKRFASWNKGLCEYLHKQTDYLDRYANNPEFLQELNKLKTLDGKNADRKRDEFCRKWHLQHFPWVINEERTVSVGCIVGFIDKNGKKRMFYNKQGKLLRRNRKQYIKELASEEGIDAWRLIVERKTEKRIINDLVPISPNINFVRFDESKSIEKGNVKEVRLTISAKDTYTKNAIQHAYKELQEYQKCFCLDPYDKKKKRKLNPKQDIKLVKDRSGKVIDVQWLITSNDLLTVKELLRGYSEYKKMKEQHGFAEWRLRSKGQRDMLFVELYDRVIREHPTYNETKTLNTISAILVKRHSELVRKMVLEHIRGRDELFANYFKGSKKNYVLTIQELPKVYEKLHGSNEWKRYYREQYKEFIDTKDEWRHTPLENVIRKAVNRYKNKA